ncbi:MAG: SprT-like domain-containing protein [Muribaculaceae bacterium]|nr:SprT-like domain-containing protein [Muribaculaceae bacterium]MBQ1722719.1 SprT-like domain-containing protein [Muribaculaceae bacterium]MBQ2490255.1 SprT-like domain-containing protein [Muribaculaceae bacterium]MBQ3960910.1 SprT-like domain-containing protein [Muribaculaceae bacterium]MBQ4007753.1 SprT-like domain-containing protein [Muribaculaceae bacterium]
MKASIELIEEKFNEYNKMYFNNELFKPTFRLKRSFGTLGLFVCTRKSLQKGRRLWGTAIEISCYYDWTEEMLRDIIVHEMIHFYLAKKHIDDTLSHGEAFLAMANRLNREYGLSIAVSYHGHRMKRAQGAPRIGWFLHKWIA